MAQPGLVRTIAPPVGLVGLLVGLMLMLAGAFRSKVAAGPPGADPAPTVTRTARVERVEVVDTVEQAGTVRARVEALVASKLLAQVASVEVEPGASVRGPGAAPPGATVVATLDARDLRAALARAEAQARAAARAVEGQEAAVTAARAEEAAARARQERAEADLRRVQALLGQGVSTPEQLDQVRAARDVAAADLAVARARIEAAGRALARVAEEQVAAQRAVEEAQVLIGYTTLTAPFDGVVTERLVEPGDTVRPGQGVARVEDPRARELHAAVAESLAARLRLGQALEVHVDALGRAFAGTIREVAPTADPRSRTLRVKVTLPPDPALVTGLFGRLAIPIGALEVLAVPRAAVARTGQLDLVRVVDEAGRARRRFVTLGRDVPGDRVEVLSGLAHGERVALP